MSDEDFGTEIGKVKSKSKAITKKLDPSDMRSRVKVAMTTSGSMMGSGGNFYSPELSTDFLELPQSPR